MPTDKHVVIVDEVADLLPRATAPVPSIEKLRDLADVLRPAEPPARPRPVRETPATGVTVFHEIRIVGSFFMTQNDFSWT